MKYWRAMGEVLNDVSCALEGGTSAAPRLFVS